MALLNKFSKWALPGLMAAMLAPLTYAADSVPPTAQPVQLTPGDDGVDDSKVNPDETISGELTPPVSNGSVETHKGFAGNYLSGMYARSSGDIKDSIERLQDAYNVSPGNVAVAGQLQGMLLIDGQLDRAMLLAKNIHEANPQDTISVLLLALKDIKEHKTGEAETLLDAASANGAGQLWLPLIATWLDLDQGAIKKPVTVESLGAEIVHAESLVNYHLALINNRAGFKDAAAHNFKDAIDDPKNPPAHIMESLLAFYEQNGKPELLRPTVEAYRAANPDSQLDNKTPLTTSLQDGVAEVLFTMGSIMLEAEVVQDATIYLQLSLYLRPHFDIAALTLGSAYSELGQFARSNDVFGKVPENSRLYTMAQLHIAMNYDRLGKTGEALGKLDAMSKHAPKSYEALVAKGDLLRMHGRYAEAIPAYNQALARIPERKSYHWPLLFARGACYERLGKIDLAEQDMQAALALKPDQPDVLNFLGYSWISRGYKLAEARSMLEKAVKQRPNNGQIVDSMGWALYTLGQYDDAVKFMEKAVELLPTDPTVNEHLGDSYWRAGRKTEARFEWERALNSSPEAAQAKELETKIKDGLPDIAKPDAAPKVASSNNETTAN